MNWTRKVTNRRLGKFQEVGKTREDWELGTLVLNLTMALTLHSDYPFLVGYQFSQLQKAKHCLRCFKMP